MKNAITMSALLAGVFFAAGLGTAGADESKEELIRKLKGQADKKAQANPGVTTRGATRGATRGVSPGSTAPQVKTEERTVTFSSRGIPVAIQAAAAEETVKLSEGTTQKFEGGGASSAAPDDAVEVSYTVDPESRVSRDNILFRRGSDEFADVASLQVVRDLGEAMSDPSLRELKFVIEGHASADGSASANQALSQRRAERIVRELGSQGVTSDRLLPVGFGESKARFPAASPENLLRQDRRVIIYRLEDS